MTPNDLTAWRERMGFSKAQAARELGCSENTIAAYERRPDAKIPRYIALACTALLWSLPAYPERLPRV